ncbi:MAG: hypothetical protein NT157_03395 [Candidatus Micrarchaeota archaeon]|nr:hypothetical protein [Candidatus Micrarchaeota archaeon]
MIQRQRTKLPAQAPSNTEKTNPFWRRHLDVHKILATSGLVFLAAFSYQLAKHEIIDMPNAKRAAPVIAKTEIEPMTMLPGERGNAAAWLKVRVPATSEAKGREFKIGVTYLSNISFVIQQIEATGAKVIEVKPVKAKELKPGNSVMEQPAPGGVGSGIISQI